MSKSILQQLYDGEVYPAEVIRGKTPEYIELNHNISDETEHFKATLSPDDWKRFEKLDNMKFERSSAYTFENFTYGFRLGVALMIEALADGGELVRNDE